MLHIQIQIWMWQWYNTNSVYQRNRPHHHCITTKSNKACQFRSLSYAYWNSRQLQHKKHQLEYIWLWHKLPMTSICQALVQNTIGVNSHLSISNQLFPLFYHYSLAPCLAHRLSIARYFSSLHSCITCWFSYVLHLSNSLIHHHTLPYIIILTSPIFIVLK
jgi:hypothetical protein